MDLCMSFAYQARKDILYHFNKSVKTLLGKYIHHGGQLYNIFA